MKGSLSGVYFKNSNKLIDFEVAHTPEEVFDDIEINPSKLEDCGTHTNGTNQTNLVPPNKALSLWEGCYPGILDQSIHVYLGIAIGNHLFTRLDNSVERTLEYIETIVSETNAIYISQLNVKLHVRKVVISKTSAQRLGIILIVKIRFIHNLINLRITSARQMKHYGIY